MRCIDDKDLQLLPLGYCLVHLLFVYPPGFNHQPAYMVALYRQAKLLFRHRKACPNGRQFGLARSKLVYKP